MRMALFTMCSRRKYMLPGVSDTALHHTENLWLTLPYRLHTVLGNGQGHW